MNLPRYKCHKVVQAGKIGGFEPLRPKDDFVEIVLETGDVVRESASWVLNKRAEVGGYYVVYDDGYTSFSPAKAFEDGYTRIEDEG